MKKLLLILAYSFTIIFIAGCELNSNEIETQLFKSEDVRKTSKAGVEETSYYGEIFNHQTIQAEFDAIGGGFEPEIGVEERATLLNYYEELADDEMYLVMSTLVPIFPIDMPFPPCPPDPRRDCRIPHIDLSSFTLSVFCQNPEMVSSSITTEEGILAELNGVEYDEQYQMALITYNLVNADLTHLSSSVNITTGVVMDGKEQEVVIEMPVVGEIFY